MFIIYNICTIDIGVELFKENSMVDLVAYQDFVLSVTSDESRMVTDLMDRLDSVSNSDAYINASLILTAAIGIGSEAGEFQEIIKKVMFQGKPYTEELRQHLIDELGDVMWYVANAANALDVDLDDVVEGNIAKLEKRYPGGFDVYRSENRDE